MRKVYCYGMIGTSGVTTAEWIVTQGICSVCMAIDCISLFLRDLRHSSTVRQFECCCIVLVILACAKPSNYSMRAGSCTELWLIRK